MRFLKKLFSRDKSSADKPSTELWDLFTESPYLLAQNVKVIRWTDDPDGLSTEECARKGIESVAGLLVKTASVSDQEFLSCAEFYYSTGDSVTDFIGAYFRQVEFVYHQHHDEKLPYPLVGEELVKMIIQPLSDGRFTATWNTIDRSRRDESLHNVGMMMNDENMTMTNFSPLPIGHIPPQEWDDHCIASFLITKTKANCWWIWRRFSPVSIRGEYVCQEDGFREETYVPIYPDYDPDSSRIFRIKDGDGNTQISW